MELLRDIIGWVLVLGGCFFTVVGAFGLVRLPDVARSVGEHAVVRYDAESGSGLFVCGHSTALPLPASLSMVRAWSKTPNT